MFTVHYLNRVSGAEYYRTVRADNVSEAMRIAKRYERKGFIYTTIKQKGF